MVGRYLVFEVIFALPLEDVWLDLFLEFLEHPLPSRQCVIAGSPLSSRFNRLDVLDLEYVFLPDQLLASAHPQQAIKLLQPVQKRGSRQDNDVSIVGENLGDIFGGVGVFVLCFVAFVQENIFEVLLIILQATGQLLFGKHRVGRYHQVWIISSAVELGNKTLEGRLESTSKYMSFSRYIPIFCFLEDLISLFGTFHASGNDTHLNGRRFSWEVLEELVYLCLPCRVDDGNGAYDHGIPDSLRAHET